MPRVKKRFVIFSMSESLHPFEFAAAHAVVVGGGGVVRTGEVVHAVGEIKKEFLRGGPAGAMGGGGEGAVGVDEKLAVEALGLAGNRIITLGDHVRGAGVVDDQGVHARAFVVADEVDHDLAPRSAADAGGGSGGKRAGGGEEGQPREMEHGRNPAIDLDGRATHYSLSITHDSFGMSLSQGSILLRAQDCKGTWRWSFPVFL